MPLKARLPKDAPPSEAEKGFYKVEPDGSFILDLEGADQHPDFKPAEQTPKPDSSTPPEKNEAQKQLEADLAKLKADYQAKEAALKAKQAELEQTNKALNGVKPEDVAKLQQEAAAKQAELEQLFKHLDGVDPAMVPHYKQAKAKLESLMEDAKVQTKLYDEAVARTRRLEVENALMPLAAKKGVQTTAIADLIARARDAKLVIHEGKLTQLKDGKPLTVSENGKDRVYGVDDFFMQQKESAPHLFQPSNGGGSQTTTPATNGASQSQHPKSTLEALRDARSLTCQP